MQKNKSIYCLISICAAICVLSGCSGASDTAPVSTSEPSAVESVSAQSSVSSTADESEVSEMSEEVQSSAESSYESSTDTPSAAEESSEIPESSAEESSETPSDLQESMPDTSEDNNSKWDEYVSLLNEFVSSGSWAKISETEIQDNHSLFGSDVMSYNDIINPSEWSVTDENKHIFDMDGDGIPEMLLRIESSEYTAGPTGPASNTEFVAIKNGRASIIMNAYWTGGTMRGNSISVCKNSTDSKYYIAFNSQLHVDAGNNSSSNTYYAYSNGNASEINNITKASSYDWSNGNSEPNITCTINGSESTESEFDNIVNSYAIVPFDELSNLVP